MAEPSPSMVARQHSHPSVHVQQQISTDGSPSRSIHSESTNKSNTSDKVMVDEIGDDEEGDPVKPKIAKDRFCNDFTLFYVLN